MLAPLLCVFLGFLGVHKFAEKNIKWGLIYFFTFGLFFVGWIFDIVKYYKKYKEIGGHNFKVYKTVVIVWAIFFCIYGTALAIGANYIANEAKNIIADKSSDNTEYIPPTEGNKPDESVEPNESIEPDENNSFTWKTLLLDRDRYKQVLMLVSENFLAGEVNDVLQSSLSTDEITLVEALFSYSNSNNDLPDDLKESFTTFCKADEYKNMFSESDNEFYNTVSKGFQISWKSSDETYYINLYKIPESDYSPDKKYLDAERYVNNGCILYILNNGQYEEYATVEDVRYGTVIDDVCYGFAIKLDFLDEELNVEEYKDGDWFFNIVRSEDGTPKYYVSVNDLNRRASANKVDYLSFWKWKPLGDGRNKKGLDVYMGAGSCKSYQFTIVDTDVLSDYMLVRYPSGNEEVKDKVQ